MNYIQYPVPVWPENPTVCSVCDMHCTFIYGTRDGKPVCSDFCLNPNNEKRILTLYPDSEGSAYA